eukprot:1039341-Prymnesium_polylepis.1
MGATARASVVAVAQPASGGTAATQRAPIVAFEAAAGGVPAAEAADAQPTANRDPKWSALKAAVSEGTLVG